MVTYSQLKGFTLIEILIVASIISIILMFALPSYQAQIDKARRTDAKSILLEGAQFLERCYTMNNSYADCTAPATTSPDGFYSVATELNEATFSIVATPREVQTRDAALCASFSINQLGQKTATGTLGNECWL